MSDKGGTVGGLEGVPGDGVKERAAVSNRSAADCAFSWPVPQLDRLYLLMFLHVSTAKG